MKKLVIILLVVSAASCSFAQQANKDSLLQLLTVVKEDTNKVNLLYKISEQYDNSEIEKAKTFIAEAGRLSLKLKYTAGNIRFNKRMIYVYAILSQNDSAIWYGQKMYETALQAGDSLNMGIALFNIGERYNFKSDYETGLKYSLRGMHLLEGKGYPLRIEAVMTGSIAASYLMLKDYEKSIEYGKKAEILDRKQENKTSLTGTLINLGNAYDETGRFAEAAEVYKEAMILCKETENLSYEIMVYEGLASIANKQNKLPEVKENAEKGLLLAQQLSDTFHIMSCKQGLSIYYLKTREYQKAKMLLTEALDIANKYDYKEQKAAILKTLGNISFAEQDFSSGEKYQNEAEKILSGIFTSQLTQNLANYREQYETEKKEVQIKLQAATIKQKNTLNYILIGSAFALLIISLLTYRNYQNKQKLQQQRIAELETEKQLTATEAVLQGEEQERTRLAKDLHDGLGGMLSGIKYSLSNMKGNLIMTPDNAQAFERSMDMLDSSIKEMRRVAHNMMPEVLVKYGLDTALKEYCLEINNSGVIQTSYHSIDLANAQMDQTISVTIYRIVQELVNNAIKHAAAKNVLVQAHVTEAGKLLTVTVEDDGKGFDPDALKCASGIGWSNIQNRVDFLKGKIDMQTGEGKGTSVLIEINV